MFTVNRNPTTRDLQKFGQAMIIGFSLIGVILWIIPWWKNNQETIISWTGTGAHTTRSGAASALTAGPAAP